MWQRWSGHSPTAPSDGDESSRFHRPIVEPGSSPACAILIHSQGSRIARISDVTSDPATSYRSSHLDKGEDYDRDLSRGFGQYMTVREHEILGRVVARLFPRGVPAYLDFACGTGRITRHMEGMAAQAWGIDVSPNMLRTAGSKCSRAQFILADATQDALDLPPLDLVTAFRFFPNADDPLRHAALDAIHRLLKPGGYLILNNHRNSSSLHRLLTDRDRRSVGIGQWQLKKILRQHGFQTVRSYGIGVWFLRYRFDRPSVLESRTVRLLEPLSRIRMLDLICPDSVIVARRSGRRKDVRRR